MTTGVIPLRAICLALLLSVWGCGDGLPKRYPAGGVVRFDDGRPVRNATIEFVPEAKGPSPRGRIDRDGHFVLGTYEGADGAPAGDYRVVVIQPLRPGADRVASTLGEEHQSHAGDIPIVSAKHASPDTSGIEATVQPIASNEFDVVVEAQ